MTTTDLTDANWNITAHGDLSLENGNVDDERENIAGPRVTIKNRRMPPALPS